MDPNEVLAQQLQVLETVPDSYIVVSPELIILTASDAYLLNTLKRREELVGRYLFDAFPDNPAAPEANAVRNWRASLERVIATGKPHQMALQHYDVLDPERPGHFVERHWKPLNTPVFDAQGKLRYIIHSSVNVTEEVLSRQALRLSQDREHDALAEAERERQRLSHLVMHAPAAICFHQGPDLVYEFVNPGYQQLFPGQQLVGKPLLEICLGCGTRPSGSSCRKFTGPGRAGRRTRCAFRWRAPPARSSPMPTSITRFRPATTNTSR